MQWLFPEPLPFHSLAKMFLRIFGRSSMRHSSNDHRFCYNFRVYTYTRARSKCQHLLEPGHFTVAATTRTNAATKSWISLKPKFVVFACICWYFLLLWSISSHIHLSKLSPFVVFNHPKSTRTFTVCFDSSQMTTDFHIQETLDLSFKRNEQTIILSHVVLFPEVWSLKEKSTDCRFDR